jgi:hypothetical protein
MFADPGGSAIQRLITQCVSLIILIQRCVDEGRASSAAHFHAVLQTLRPKHAAHLPAYESICKSIETIHMQLTQPRAAGEK